MPGPAKLNENTKIPRRAPNLGDDFYFAAPGTGLGGVNQLAALLTLLGSVAPVTSFADIDEMLDNTTIQLNYFAFVTDASDDVGQPGWGLYFYIGPDRDDIDSYQLTIYEAGLAGTAPGLGTVLATSNDALAGQIKNAANATDPQDLTTLAQVATLIGAIGTPPLSDVLTIGNDAGGHKIIGLVAGAGPGEAVEYSQLNTAITAALEGLNWKQGVRMKTTGNITLSGLQTIDTIVGVADDRVLVGSQSTASQNGIYLMKSGAWVRTTDANSSAELQNAIVSVAEGSQQNTTWRQETDNVTVGSSSIVWTSFGSASPNASTSVNGTSEEADDAETIAGTVTGGTGARLFVGPSRLAAWWTDAKTKVQTWALAQTFTVGPTVSDATASMPAFFDASKKLVSTTAAALLTFLGITQAGTGIRAAFYNAAGALLRIADVEWDSTNKTLSIRGANDLVGTYSLIVYNQSGNVIMQLSNAQVAEFPSAAGVAYITIPTTVTVGNAGIIAHDAVGIVFRIKDDTASDYLMFEKTSGSIKQIKEAVRVVRDMNLGFEVITLQNTAITSVTAAAQNNLVTFAIPTDFSISFHANVAKAYASADGSMIDADIFFSAKNVAGTVTSDITVVHRRLPGTLNGSFNVVVSGTNIILRFQNETGTGKIYTIFLDYTYSLIELP